MSDNLLKIASELLTRYPSDDPDDYDYRVPKWVLREFANVREQNRQYAIRIRAIYNKLQKSEHPDSDIMRGAG